MNRLELSQSKYQSVFCRFYEMIASLLWYIGLTAVISVLFSTKFDPLIIIFTTVVFALMFAAYIWFFYAGRSKRIIFLKDGFEFYNYENKRTVNWSEYEGYKITKSIPSEIRIKVHDRTDVVFTKEAKFGGLYVDNLVDFTDTDLCSAFFSGNLHY